MPTECGLYGRVPLQSLADRGDTRLHFFCGTDVQRGIHGCRHNREMPLAEAINLWGPLANLHGLPVKCSKCGGRYILVGSLGPDKGY